MGAMSDYLENKILDHCLKGTAFTSPSGVYVGLFKAVTGLEANTIASASEVSGGSYARVKVGGGASINFNSASAGATTNANDIEFPVATADWGTITHVAILDSATLGAGNILFWAALPTSKTVYNGDGFKFRAGDMSVTLD